MSERTLIRNATVVDGTGGEPFVSDIVICGDRIEYIGQASGGSNACYKLVIDAAGMVACPGFIDAHGHSDGEILANKYCESKVMQGITTEVCGNCGFSPAPIAGESGAVQLMAPPRKDSAQAHWRRLGEFLAALENNGLSMNVVTFVGHNTIRSVVMGEDDRAPSEDELLRMKTLLSEALEDGAIGLSSGLIYSPGCFSQPDELIELCRVVRHYNGLYATHMRNESYELIEAVHEAIDVARQTAVPVQISHHKAVGKDNWGKVELTLQMIERANQQGLDITCDQYPYTATATSLKMVLPRWVHSGGVEQLLQRLRDKSTLQRIRKELENALRSDDEWAQIIVSEVAHEHLKQFEGLNMTEVAEALNKEPFDALVYVLVEDKAQTTMVRFSLSEEDVICVMRYHRTMFGTDASARKLKWGKEETPSGKPHPRAFGTFPRILGRYVRERQILTLTEAIRKMTSLPASKFGLSGRGELKRNSYADIVIFDPQSVIDASTYEEPYKAPIGIRHVFVNGIAVVLDGQLTGALPGRVIRRCS
ncbi:MAG: D-aminoacylase [Armatimonadota bacterium]|nr:D-aminoacylase [Armatimonadota bacterium]MDW8024841.1 D-aminoacylase [Armatimonadota bacterium]